eukprot:13411061-Ditylum_brightwellii.AAC.1
MTAVSGGQRSGHIAWKKLHTCVCTCVYMDICSKNRRCTLSPSGKNGQLQELNPYLFHPKEGSCP